MLSGRVYLATAAARRQGVSNPAGSLSIGQVVRAVGGLALRVEGQVRILARRDGPQALAKDMRRVHGARLPRCRDLCQLRVFGGPRCRACEGGRREPLNLAAGMLGDKRTRGVKPQSVSRLVRRSRGADSRVWRCDGARRE